MPELSARLVEHPVPSAVGLATGRRSAGDRGRQFAARPLGDRPRARHRQVAADLGWTVLERGRQPVLNTGNELLCVVHPLDPVDGRFDSGVTTPHGQALPFDCLTAGQAKCFGGFESAASLLRPGVAGVSMEDGRWSMLRHVSERTAQARRGHANEYSWIAFVQWTASWELSTALDPTSGRGSCRILPRWFDPDLLLDGKPAASSAKDRAHSARPSPAARRAPSSSLYRGIRPPRPLAQGAGFAKLRVPNRVRR